MESRGARISAPGAGARPLELPSLVIDLVTGDLEASPALRELLELSPGEPVTPSLLRECTPLSDLIAEGEHLASLRSGSQRSVAYSKQYLTRSGRRVPAAVHAFVLDGEGGSPRWLLAMVLIAGPHIELAHRDEQTSLVDHIFHAIPIPLAIWRSCDGKVMYANQALSSLTGRATADIVGRSFAEVPLTRPDDRSRMSDELERAGVVHDQEVRYTDAQGCRRIGSLSCVKFQAGGTELIITSVYDLTERRELDTQLLQAQKMEAVGQLAGGIAHDFNNLLTAIGGHAELLLMTTPSADGVRAAAQVIRDATDRASALTRQLLDFARRGTNRVVPVHLGGVVDSVRRLVAPSLGGSLSVEASCTAAHPVVRGDPSQLEQVLVNLLINARDAMADQGGVISVRLEDGEAPGWVRLEVADTGRGIAPEHLPHVFEPFFTTKGPGAGTGLGLAAAYGIVRQHKGAISVYSQPGAGTRFRVELPTVQEPVPAPRSLALGPRNSNTLLLVDDDPLVRNLTQRMLERLGHRVVAVADGAAAVAAYEEMPSPPAAVLLDVVMPVMDGPTCLGALLALDPQARVIVCTGFAGEQRVQRMLDAGAVGFLQKPYTPAELFDVLAKAIRV